MASGIRVPALAASPIITVSPSAMPSLSTPNPKVTAPRPQAAPNSPTSSRERMLVDARTVPRCGIVREASTQGHSKYAALEKTNQVFSGPSRACISWAA